MSAALLATEFFRGRPPLGFLTGCDSSIDMDSSVIEVREGSRSSAWMIESMLDSSVVSSGVAARALVVFFCFAAASAGISEGLKAVGLNLLAWSVFGLLLLGEALITHHLWSITSK